MKDVVRIKLVSYSVNVNINKHIHLSWYIPILKFYFIYKNALLYTILGPL